MSKFRLWLLLICGVGLWFVHPVSAQELSEARGQISDNNGYAVVPGKVKFELFIDPPAASPGTLIQLRFVVTNNSLLPASPEILIPLTDNLALDTGILPAGASFNTTTHQTSWQPFVPAGESRSFQLDFTVETANLNHPLATFDATFIFENQVHDVQATYWVGIAPTATILTDHTQAAVGQPIQLAAELGGSAPIQQTWNLGDGRIVIADNPSVVYGNAGIYEITLTASNPLAQTSVSTIVEVLNTPEALFSISDSTPGIGQAIQFINASGGQPPLTYHWDFGDGTTSQEREPVHVYENAGNFIATLSVTSVGGQDNYILPIAVSSNPTIQILSLPQNVIAGETFFAQALGDPSINSYYWDMGDGTIKDGAETSHTYFTHGDFYVWLIATNNFGTSQIGQWINVQPSPNIFTTFLPVIVTAGDITTTNTILRTEGTSNVTPVSVDRNTDDNFVPISLDQPAPLSESATEAELLLWYANEARRIHSLPPLTYVHELSVAAQRHAEDMAINMFTSHTGSDGSRPYERLPKYGYSNDYAGEATAWGFADARRAVEFWVNSPPHRRIILNPDAIELGVGYAVNYEAPSVWYWVAEFGEARETDAEK